jgi:hypothetical protein
MTFKQKVEEILDPRCRGVVNGEAIKRCALFNGDVYLDCKECRLDRILAAYKEAVEGMPLHPYPEDGVFEPTSIVRAGFNSGAEMQLEACKEHLQKEAPDFL